MIQQTRWIFLSIVLACTGQFLITLNDAFMKDLLLEMPLSELLFLRSAGCISVLIMCVPFVGGLKRLVPGDWRSALIVGLLLVPTLFLFPLSLYFLPLTTALVLVYISPVFLVLIAPFFKGHGRPGPRRLVAVAVGFAGAFVVVDPSISGVSLAITIPLFCAFLIAVRDLAIRQAVRSSHPISLSLITFSATLILSAFLGLFQQWTALDWSTGLRVFAAAVSIAVGQLLMIVTFTMAAAPLIATMKYTSVVWSVLLSYLFWMQMPQSNEMIGAAFIVISGVAIVLIRDKATLKGIVN